jgi:hypothetical protein
VNRSAPLLALAVAASLALAAIASCSGSDIVLATIPTSDGGDAASAPLLCNVNANCPSGSYCDKAACGDLSGTCQLFPAECGQAPELAVCGCDGITYFDDCWRQAGGIAASSKGPCSLGNAKRCGGPSRPMCPSGTYCAQLGETGPGPCGPDDVGTCWVLPLTCPPMGFDLWTPCQGGHCFDTCNAIRDGGAYRRVQSPQDCH